MRIVCDKCGEDGAWRERDCQECAPGQVRLTCGKCGHLKVVARCEYAAYEERLFQSAMVSAVQSVSKDGYAVAANARLLGLETALGKWVTLTNKEKAEIWSGMKTGKFVLYAGTMNYLSRCANKSTVPVWDVTTGQPMSTGQDEIDSQLFGILGSAQFELDIDWMNGIQIRRLEAARAKWRELHGIDVDILLAKLAEAAARLTSLSEAERRGLLREARQTWNDEQPHLSDGQKASLRTVISNLWNSIHPRWWEFRLRARPKELGPAN